MQKFIKFLLTSQVVQDINIPNDMLTFTLPENKTTVPRHVALRFAAQYKINKKGCWLWLSALNHLGYGSFSIGGKIQRAHRVAYEMYKGPIPKGLTIDHICRVRSCVNPEHLEPVTQRTNILRGRAPSAVNARKTHCINGHPFDKENTYFWKGYMRQCRECGRRNTMRYLKKRKRK